MKNLMLVVGVAFLSLAGEVRIQPGVAPAVGAAAAILTDGQIDVSTVRTIRASLSGPERSMLLSRFGADQVAWLDQLGKHIDSEAASLSVMIASARIRAAAGGVPFQVSSKEKDWFEQLLPYYSARRRMLWRDLETVEQQMAAGRAAVEARVQLIRAPMDSHFARHFTASEIESLQEKGLCMTRSKAATLPFYPPKPMRGSAYSAADSTPAPETNGL